MKDENWTEFPATQGRGRRTTCAVRYNSKSYTLALCPDALDVFSGATNVRRYIDAERKLIGLRASGDNQDGSLKIWYTGQSTTANVSAGNLRNSIGITLTVEDGMTVVPHYVEDGMLVLDLSGLPQAEDD